MASKPTEGQHGVDRGKNRGVRLDGPLGLALRPYREAGISIVLLSIALNVLALTGSIYLMLVYDRVLLSGSVPSLLTIFAIVIVLYLFQGAFDTQRARLLDMTGQGLDRALAGRLQALESDLAVRGELAALPSTPLRDLDHIRSFMAGQGITALIDLPWIAFFLLVLWLLHPLLALTTLAGALVLGVVTWANDRQTRSGVDEANRLARQRALVAERVRRNLGAIRGLGIASRMDALATAAHEGFVARQSALAQTLAKYLALGRGMRMFVQSAVLTVGAFLVIDHQATGGIIFASSILSGRALAPVDQVIANWRNFIGARQAWQRLEPLLASHPERAEPSVLLEAPRASLSVDGLTVAPPGSERAVVQQVSFALSAGDALAVVGASGSGKSSLARAIVNFWPAQQGAVRLDGAPLGQYHEHRLRDALGYLPQEVELLAGTIAQNISRFDPAPPSDKVIAAARAAGIHDFVLALPDGYDTPLGESGATLSAGQRQRVALARALYGDPFLLVLDEPDSNLDPEGEAALGRAIATVRQRRGIVVVITHRGALLGQVNTMLVMQAGQVGLFGPRGEVIAALKAKAAQPKAAQQGATA